MRLVQRHPWTTGACVAAALAELVLILAGQT